MGKEITGGSCDGTKTFFHNLHSLDKNLKTPPDELEKKGPKRENLETRRGIFNWSVQYGGAKIKTEYIGNLERLV